MKTKKKKKQIFMDYVKANRHGEWLALNEDSTGFVSIHKTHKSAKTYNRKQKNYEI